MHDPYLTRITNIRNITDFASRYETRQYNGGNKTDWWTDTFTLNELRRLGIKQAQAQAASLCLITSLRSPCWMMWWTCA